ncbi:Thiol-disulfide isomerase or thioredoxin [Salinimicrobium sediminis]|uniref:Thiol-disulfide isomerase or thioredoxin n=1 Tax=Salinimicrobium sediminis TaxID=1343891 RepID=A0A285XAI7_9FLAO|nr:TlpA disulfide reductase family protein [Salinimicrobium sediminis]SOC81449.1 Thiol-disulfide isomerase or thioredoxin [Salinimicrobium sediminis]
MRKILLFFLTQILVVPLFAQQDQISFSEALTTHLPKYKKQADKAYRTENLKRADFLFDSLVKYGLKGSKMDNFKVQDLKKKPVALDEFQKPVYLTTYASWIVPTEGEIPALNKLSEKYGDQVDFVMLFWDSHSTTKELAKKYNKNITVLYVDEMKNDSPYVIKMMKHSLGFPTSFLLNKDKNIIDIRRKVSHPFGIEFEKSFDLNYDSFTSAISLLLINDSSQYSQAEKTLTP